MLKLFVLLTLISFVFTDDTTNTCLDKETLTNLGFIVEDTATKVDSPTYCTDVYADPGRCIATDNIKTIIEKLEADFKLRIDEFDDILKIFFYLFKNDTEREELRTLVINENKIDGISWKEKIAYHASFANDSHLGCFRTYNKLTHGLSCLLSSGKIQ